MRWLVAVLVAASACAMEEPDGSSSFRSEAVPDDPQGGGFVPALDVGGGAFPCDVYVQDCPTGLKCTPTADSGGAWDNWSCVPLDEQPVGPGEPCISDSAAQGLDNCARGSLCWDADPETGAGTCVAMPVGAATSAICLDPLTVLSASASGSMVLCLPSCSPLTQDCALGQACYPAVDGFVCAPDVSGDEGAQGDSCEFPNVCDPGLLCTQRDVGECDGAGCCTAYCELDAPSCPDGLACAPLFEDGLAAPPGLEGVGYCANGA